ETVDVPKLTLLGLGRTGHAGEVLVEAEQILERDRRQRLILASNLDAFLGFDRLMDAVRVAAAVHQPSRKFVDDDDFAVFDDVMLIGVEEMPRFERRVELVRQLDIALVVEILDTQHLFDRSDAGFRYWNGVRLLVDGKMFVLLQAGQELSELLVEFARLL